MISRRIINSKNKGKPRHNIHQKSATYFAIWIYSYIHQIDNNRQNKTLYKIGVEISINIFLGDVKVTCNCSDISKVYRIFNQLFQKLSISINFAFSVCNIFTNFQKTSNIGDTSKNFDILFHTSHAINIIFYL